MKGKILLISLLVLAIALSGCVGQPDATGFVKSLPDVQAFLAENPDADIVAVFLSEDAVKATIGNIREECGQQMQEVPYWHVTITKGEERVEVYLDETGQQALCILKPGTEQPEDQTGGPEGQTDEPEDQDQCRTNQDCDDQDPETKDECDGRPRRCFNTATTQPEDECQTNADCDDGNPATTVDECEGTPKKCYNYNPETTQPEGECQTNNDCDDGDSTTLDECEGTPRTCYNTVTQDECQTNADCDDGNPATTTDECEGTPRKCYNY
jgi:hypothetical protein